MKFHTDTKNASRDIPVTWLANLLEVVSEHARIVCVELIEGAMPLPEYQHADRAFYIFGPEDGTISQAPIDKADDVANVPTRGCMNLAATANVVLYGRMAKSALKIDGNELIRQSRDQNNRGKVKPGRHFGRSEPP